MANCPGSHADTMAWGGQRWRSGGEASSAVRLGAGSPGKRPRRVADGYRNGCPEQTSLSPLEGFMSSLLPHKSMADGKAPVSPSGCGRPRQRTMAD